MDPVTPMNGKKPAWIAAGFAAELGYGIAVPLVLFAGAGRLLDRRFGSAPWLLIAGILLALVTSVLWLMRKVRVMAAEIDRLAGSGPKDTP